ncbi:MAG: hypothetical protein WCT50_02235 [Patescibacteria group bacterium]|jgi:hypothetical protein
MKKFIKLSILLSLFLFLIIPFSVGAQIGDRQYQEDFEPDLQADETSLNPPPANPSNMPTLKERLMSVGGAAGFTTDETKASTPRIVGLIVGAFINFTGLTFIVLMIIAGYGWMTSNGNEEKVKKSVSTIKASIIGLIVSLSAWAIWSLIFQRLIIGG